MANGTTLGTAYVQIIPSMEGTSEKLTNALDLEGQSAGKSAGEKAGSSLMNGINDTVSKSNLSSISKVVSDAGKSISDVGSSLTKNVTAPLVAFKASAIAAFKTYDSGADTIIQKTGASGEALEAMQKSMENITATIPVGFESAGAAIGEVNTRFGLTGDALEDLSTKFLEFAELNGTDVSNSIDVVQKAMAAYGVSTEDAGAMLDTLNKVGQDTGINVDSLAQSMTSNAQSLKEMGLSASDAATLIGSLEKTGIDTSTVMVGMKKVLAEAVESGTSGQEAFAKAVSSSEEAVSIFGSKAGPMLYSAFQDGTLSMDMFQGGLTSLEDNLGNVSDTYESTLDPIDQFTTLMNSAIPVLADIGNSLIEVLLPLLDSAKNAIQEATDFWNSLDSTAQQLILTVGLVAAAIGPVVSAIGGFISNIGAIGSAMSGVATFISGTMIPAIGSVIAPVLAVVGVIAVIVAAVVNLYNTNEEFRNNVSAMLNAVIANVSLIASQVQDLISAFISFVQPIVQTFLEYIGTLVNDNLTNINNIVSGVFSVIQGLLDIFIGLFTGNWEQCWDGVKTFLSGITDALKGIISTAFNVIKSVISTVLNTVSSVFSNIWNGIKNTVSNIINGISTNISNVFNGIKNTVTNIWNAVKTAITNPIETAKNTVKGIIDTIKGFFNFKISWPSIPMPHFSVKPSGWQIGDLLKGSIPSLGISWYAKAMDEPYMLSKATLIGAGEKGDEVIYGHNQLMNDIKEAVSESNPKQVDQRPIYINVYAKDQDEKKIAKEVSDLLNKQMLRGAF